MGLFSRFFKPDPAADAEAAAILNGLLDGKLTPPEARARWPRGRLSQPSAKTYLEYFEKGFDGEGRLESIDGMVRTLARLLERSASAASRGDATADKQ